MPGLYTGSADGDLFWNPGTGAGEGCTAAGVSPHPKGKHGAHHRPSVLRYDAGAERLGHQPAF